jgi:hypothetical protein
MKICKACLVEKPLTEYYKDRHTTTGYISKCKECISNKLKVFTSIAKDGYKICTECKKEKILNDFSKHTSGGRGVRAKCKQCTSNTAPCHRPKDVEATRICKSCFVEKSITSFHTSVGNTSGRKHICAVCVNNSKTNYEVEYEGGKTCTSCNETKTLIEFDINLKLKQGRDTQCNSCQNKVRAKDREANKEVFTLKNRKYSQDNKGKVNAKTAKRKAAKLQATPKWANLKLIEDIYVSCAEKQILEKEKYAVDHIVPLQGDNVCGLHVEYNLQILTRKSNAQKLNKLLLEVTNQVTNPNPRGIPYGSK